MVEIIGVRFKDSGKMYYFDPNGLQIKEGQNVVVETARGEECGTAVMGNRQVPENQIVSPLKKAIRAATEADVHVIKENREKEKKAFAICTEKIEKRGLDMKLVDVEYTFDNSKILFYFTADGRVDFRELVKDLAGVFRTRIELRQIGVRDEAKMLGGLGICGRPFCCSSYMGDFQPVSIKMAKEQGLSLNPVKISGTCGRLMCCLKYEQNVYEELLAVTPRNGALVKTPDGRGTVVDVSLLAGTLKVQSEKDPEAAPKTYRRDEVRTLRDGRNRTEEKEARELKNLEKD